MTAAEEVRQAALAGGPHGKEAERAALLALARRSPAPLDVDPGFDWDHLLSAAERHGLLPLLAAHAAAGVFGPPEAVAVRLRAAAAFHTADNLRLAGVLHGIAEVFRAEGIPFLAFKGPALAVQAYGHLGRRPIGDLDVVVPPAERTRAEAALGGLGFRPELELTPAGEAALARWEHHRAYVDAGRETLVELHWAFAPPRFGVGIPAGEIVGRAASIEVAGGAVPVPEPTDQVLLLCVHGARHLWDRLEWVAALAEMLRRQPPDGPVLEERAREAGAVRILRVGLLLAEGLLDAPTDAGSGDPLAVALARTAAARLFAEAPPAQEVEAKPELFLFNLRAKDRAADRLRFAVRYLTTPTEDYWYGPRLPDALFPLYRLSRPFRLGAQYLRARLAR